MLYQDLMLEQAINLISKYHEVFILRHSIDFSPVFPRRSRQLVLNRRKPGLVMVSAPPTPPSHDPQNRKNYRFHGNGAPCEWIEAYYPGSFHPVHLGDVFQDRYEVIRKLGNGSLGTVWLALDRQ